MKSSLVFIWQSNDDYVLLRQSIPFFQREFRLQQRQIITPGDKRLDNFKRKIAKVIGRKTKQTIIARGNSNVFVSGNFNEIPMHVQVGIYGGGVHTTKNMVCNGAASWGTYEWVPIREIFANKNQTVFKEQLIKTNK